MTTKSVIAATMSSAQNVSAHAHQDQPHQLTHLESVSTILFTFACLKVCSLSHQVSHSTIAVLKQRSPISTIAKTGSSLFIKSCIYRCDLFIIAVFAILRFYVLFNSISVISGGWKVDNERLRAMELRLWLRSFRRERGSNSVHWINRTALNPLSCRGSCLENKNSARNGSGISSLSCDVKITLQMHVYLFKVHQN